MITDFLAVTGLVVAVLVWLTIQRSAARHGLSARGMFRCGACKGDCGGSRPDCPKSRLGLDGRPGEGAPERGP